MLKRIAAIIGILLAALALLGLWILFLNQALE
jgi:hypothetical protein